MNNNIIKHNFHLSREDKEKKHEQKGTVFWLCGLSGSGKSTIANLVEKKLFQLDKTVMVLDGDSVRMGLCKDLGFSQADREENLRRVAEVAKLFAHNGNIVICCFITPLEKQREMIKEILREDFKLVYIKASVSKCEERDPKDLYKKARRGEIDSFTGISSTFEEPRKAFLTINTETDSLDESVLLLLKAIQKATSI